MVTSSNDPDILKWLSIATVTRIALDRASNRTG